MAADKASGGAATRAPEKTGTATGAAPDTLGQAPFDDEATVGDLFRRVYQLFYSKTFGLWVIIAVTALSLLGIMSTTSFVGNSERLTSLVHNLGLVDDFGQSQVFTSWPFYVLIGLLALSITACTVHRIPRLWNAWQHPKLHPSAKFFDRARFHGAVEVEAGSVAARRAVADMLRSRRFRVIDDPKDNRGVYADRFAWSGFGTVLAHTSFLVIIAAFVLSSVDEIDKVIAVPIGGAPVEVGEGTGLTVVATDYDQNIVDGRPLDYVSTLVVRDASGKEVSRDVRVNSPLTVNGVSFHQYNPAAHAVEVTVRNAFGEVVLTGILPLNGGELRDAVSGAVTAAESGAFYLSDGALEVWVATPPSNPNPEPGSLSPGEVDFYVNDHTAGTQETVRATQGVEVDLAGYTAVFERERQYTGILVRQDHGAVWMWVGSVMLVVGMTITFACRHRRVWVRVTTDGPSTTIRFASSDRKDITFERHLTGLLDKVAENLGTRAPGTPANKGGQP
jgi:cytochrome c biogenesis protein